VVNECGPIPHTCSAMSIGEPEVVHRRLNIAQIGPWPPPWGGISVYVQRLSRSLAAAGHRVTVLREGGEADPTVRDVAVLALPRGRGQALVAARHLVAIRADVAHLHLIGLPWKTVVPFVLATKAVGVPLIISVHSHVEKRDATPRMLRPLLGWAASRATATFASGAHVADALRAAGVPPAQVAELAPFLPAPIPADPTAELPAELQAMRRRYRFLVAGGASGLVRTTDGRDEYGFDVFAGLAAALGQTRGDVGFAFLLPRRIDEALYQEAMAKVHAAKLGDRFYVHESPLAEATNLWAAADVFVRPTRTDGDSVSVREALAVGTPTMASDVSIRPAGVATFQSGDGEDAARVAATLLDNLPAARAAVAALAQPDAIAPLLSAYHAAARRR
jgi:glycogen synthase